MKIKEAGQLGQHVSELVSGGRTRQACALLEPVLVARTRFPILGRIGQQLGTLPLGTVQSFLDRIAAGKSEGGWVVIGAALGEQLDRDLEGACARCRAFIIDADAWYAADILGERVPGPALLLDLPATLVALSPWREDRNRWVRRTVGVAAHFWAKRSGGASALESNAAALLKFLEPLFSEWDMDAVKGVGWGLKTLGRYYPHLVAGWLAERVVVQQRPHRALMVRKALTYLPDDPLVRALRDAP
jgi:3-methyladenine DNA glycosylase AlkD